MKRTLFLVCLISSLMAASACAQTETVVVSSFYPVPFGDFDHIQLLPRNNLLADPCDRGTIYVGPDNILRYCASDGGAPQFWEVIPPIWNQSGNNVYMRDATYNVGIRTKNPTAKLHVAGDVKWNVKLPAESKVPWTNLNGFPADCVDQVVTGFDILNGNNFICGDAGDQDWEFNGDDLYAFHTVGANGYVGIGNSAPAAILDVGTSADAASLSTVSINKGGNSAGDMIRFQTQGTTFAAIEAESDEDLIFKTFGNAPILLGTNRRDVVILTHDGRLGIGDLVPQSYLHLEVQDKGMNLPAIASSPDRYLIVEADDAKLSLYSQYDGRYGSALVFQQEAAKDDLWSFYRESNDTGDGSLRLCYNNNKNYTCNDPVLTFTKNNRVGIGVSHPQAALHINGQGMSTRAHWEQSSDVRLKDLHGNFDLGLQGINKIEPVRFTFKKDNPVELPSDKEFIGAIAQDVQKAIPEAVDVSDSGYLGTNLGTIEWSMINAIKELKERNENLKERIRKLKETIK